jgi:hypothetical protein
MKWNFVFHWQLLAIIRNRGSYTRFFYYVWSFCTYAFNCCQRILWKTVQVCLSLSHPIRECALVSDPDPDVATKLKTLGSLVLAFTSNPSPKQGQEPHTKPPDVCRNFNVGRCHMVHCRYTHVCKVCGGPNPAIACCERLLGVMSGATLHYPDQLVRHFGPGPPEMDQPSFIYMICIPITGILLNIWL